MSRLRLVWLLGFLPALAHALEICLPTANDALLRPGREAEFFQPTAEGSIESGMFGCVRRSGRRFHEGIDIKCLKRDRKGEPADPVHAVSDGVVAFINARPGLSNYGRYIVLEHRWDGVTVYTLYAHLRDIAAGLRVGQPVRKAQIIGTLGRSTNTREGIPRERAHLHFEVNFMLSPHFRLWYPKRQPKAPPLGNFNGQNFVGIDPAALYRAVAADPKLNFAGYLARQPLAFTVLVAARPFPWLQNHPHQLQPGNASEAFAYEIGSTAWGLPVAVWPRAASELSGAQRHALERGLPVLWRINETELAKANCRALLQQTGRLWQLTKRGREWVELLTWQP